MSVFIINGKFNARFAIKILPILSISTIISYFKGRILSNQGMIFNEIVTENLAMQVMDAYDKTINFIDFVLFLHNISFIYIPLCCNTI